MIFIEIEIPAALPPSSLSSALLFARIVEAASQAAKGLHELLQGRRQNMKQPKERKPSIE